jgi:hypothetical protein
MDTMKTRGAQCSSPDREGERKERAMFYVGTGKHSAEIRFDGTTVKLWDVTVNGKKYVYRGTEQAVSELVADKFYYNDWHMAPRKFLALSSQIIDV